MKKTLFLFYVIFWLTFFINAQEWSGVPVPVTLTGSDTWVLQTNVSDDFNYSAPASNKGSKFFSKWDDFYHNAWTGPGSTIWERNHSYVDGDELILIASRYQNNLVNAGAIHSNNTIIYPVYIESKIKIMNSVLANGAWMLSPDDTQEIDFMEGYGASWSASANEDVSWYAKRMHMSHHVFIRNPFQDWQPSEFSNDTGNPSPNPTWITRNDGNGDINWRDDYHTYGVYWKDPWHLYYYIDGVQVTKREGKDQIDPVFFTNSGTQGDSSNDTRTGLNKAMDILFTVEEQGWRTANGKSVVPTNSELANSENNKFKIDWIRVYKPQSSLSVNDINALKVEIYPNPSNKFVKINSNKLISAIECFDTNGKLVAFKKYDDAAIQFNTNKLSRGIYFLKITAEDGSLTRKKIMKN
ncbi:T9SS type A sorting domain-containing protein [Polaribacter marinivivus]|uniref:T9SS type A sorting domain-containing protein n=1 Tax=Polaribacter marinivivus TaxID=1524260 RepID=UPI003D33B1D5